MNILAISGSLRTASYNSALLRACKTLAPTGTSVELLEIGNLPLFNQEQEMALPEIVQNLKRKISAADGIIIATPEYNRSLPGVLKNAIDWASRPYGTNSFKGKPVLVAGVSSGKIGTAIAQSHLKEVLLYLEAEVLGQPEVYLGPAKELFDEAGNLTNESTKEFIAKALAALIARAN